MSNNRNRQNGKPQQAIGPHSDKTPPLPCAQTENERLFYLWSDVWLGYELAWQAKQAANEVEDAASSAVEKHRRCPACWGARKGFGNAYSTHGRTRYYRCSQSLTEGEDGCGMTWNHQFKTSVTMLDDKTIEVCRASQVTFKS